MFHTIWFLSMDGVVLPLLVLTLMSAGATWLIRRRGASDRHGGLVFAGLVSVSLILSVTLFRDGRLTFTPEQLLHWSVSGWQRVSYDPFSSIEVLLNVALFVPAGLCWTLLARRPLRVMAALVGLSFLIECLQAVTGLGANDVSDLIANSVGGALGVLAGSLILWLRGRAGGSLRLSRSGTALAAGSVAALVAAAVAGVLLGAEHRQASLERELNGRFAGTSLETYAAWEADDRLYEEVFAAASAFADGTRHRGDDVRVRYPASFFGLPRCVFVDWAPGDVAVHRGSGEECSAFMG
ncbi:VanZ family protein [Streptomyces durbertensis]|uniref:VanZ family protein n=1 Tax=Streptomyces durbertensis TaxID=2448886 RepID=A0ABR6EN71_9ACTN|nr:VanZ family protein [Streptomyces durbertensis]MBB1246683.1 VanZ family protein [Streptomyces durbertensis]